MVQAFYGHDPPVTCGSHSNIFGKDRGILQSSDTLAMDTMSKASLTVGTGFRLLGIHPQKLLKQVRISVGVTLFRVEHQLEHILRCLHLLRKEGGALL